MAQTVREVMTTDIVSCPSVASVTDAARHMRDRDIGDVLVVADTNFPADSVARATVTGRLLHMDNLTAAEAVNAILSVLPLDTFVDDFAGRMEMTGAPAEIPPVQVEVQAEIDRAEGRSRPMVGIERFAFYERVKDCFAVVVTGERRLYGNIILKKGIIRPE